MQIISQLASTLRMLTNKARNIVKLIVQLDTIIIGSFLILFVLLATPNWSFPIIHGINDFIFRVVTKQQMESKPKKQEAWNVPTVLTRLMSSSPKAHTPTPPLKEIWFKSHMLLTMTVASKLKALISQLRHQL